MSYSNHQRAYESEDSPQWTSVKWAWVVAIAALVLLVAGLIFFPPVFSAPEGKVSGSVLFLGRFHPIVLHMPVGAIGLLMLVELLCLRKAFEDKWGEAALFIAAFFAITSVVAVILGSMLGRDGFEGGAYKLHTFFGLLIGAGAVACLFARLLAMQQRLDGQLQQARFFQETYRFVLFCTFGIMSIGAHFGANMVHGDKYLIQHAPEFVAKSVHGFEGWMLSFVTPRKKAEPVAVVSPTVTKPTAPVQTTVPAAQVEKPSATLPPAVPVKTEPAAEAKLVFQHAVLPLLEAKCNSCHSEAKTKGKLRMDTHEMLMKGGSDGATTVIAGKPEESLALVRLMLPEDDDEHMPPAEKPQFTKNETALLRWWIFTGASATQLASEIPAELKETAEGLMKGQP